MTDLNKILHSGLLEQYVLGLVSEKERAEVECYIVNHPEVYEKVQRLRSCMEHYTGLHDIPTPKSQTARPVPAPTSVTPKSTRSLSVETKFGEPIERMTQLRNYTRLLASLAGASILFFAGLSIYFYQETAESAGALSQLNDRMSVLENQHAAALSYLSSVEGDHELLKDIKTRKMPMEGVGDMPQAKAVVYYNESEKKTYLDPVSLPVPPSNHHYLLWAEVNKKRVNMGKIEPSPNHCLIPINFINNTKTFMITLEPNDGTTSRKRKPCLVVAK